MCILYTPRPIYRPTYQPTLSCYIDVSVNIHISVRCQLMSTNTRPICRSIWQPRVVVRLSADMSIDRLLTFHRYFTPTFIGDCSLRCRHNLTCTKLVTSAEQRRYPRSTPRFSEDSLNKSGVVNCTNLTKNHLYSIEPNRPDCCSIGLVITLNRAGIFW